MEWLLSSLTHVTFETFQWFTKAFPDARPVRAPAYLDYCTKYWPDTKKKLLLWKKLGFPLSASLFTAVVCCDRLKMAKWIYDQGFPLPECLWDAMTTDTDSDSDDVTSSGCIPLLSAQICFFLFSAGLLTIDHVRAIKAHNHAQSNLQSCFVIFKKVWLKIQIGVCRIFESRS